MDTAIFEMDIFPNPTEDITTIIYTIPTTGLVMLSIYDASGNKIKTIFYERKEKGIYSLISILKN